MGPRAPEVWRWVRGSHAEQDGDPYNTGSLRTRRDTCASFYDKQSFLSLEACTCCGWQLCLSRNSRSERFLGCLERRAGIPVATRVYVRPPCARSHSNHARRTSSSPAAFHQGFPFMEDAWTRSCWVGSGLVVVAPTILGVVLA